MGELAQANSGISTPAAAVGADQLKCSFGGSALESLDLSGYIAELRQSISSRSGAAGSAEVSHEAEMLAYIQAKTGAGSVGAAIDAVRNGKLAYEVVRLWATEGLFVGKPLLIAAVLEGYPSVAPLIRYFHDDFLCAA